MRFAGLTLWQNRHVIHEGNPFAPTDDQPMRRFRGRLVAPVTVITSGKGDKKTGLTVSSLSVLEGEPNLIQAVVGPNSDLYDVVSDSGSFTVHICEVGHEGLAEVFAGLRPSPGGLFSGTEFEETEWGPVLNNLPNRAYCRFRSIELAGWTGLLVGEVDRVELAPQLQPLIHFRGTYRELI